METPPTPDHVQPDEEIIIPNGPVALDLDLNPELEDEDEVTANPFSRATPGITPGDTPISASSNGETNLLNVGNDVIEIGNSTGPGPRVGSPIRNAISSWTLPFEDAFHSLQKEFDDGSNHQPISLSQQSKFINYVDTQLLQIQRKFIKNQSDSAITYSLEQLIGDLSPIISLLWYSLLDHESLFGQEEYYIKIMGDLEDWVGYYSLPTITPEQATEMNFYIKLFDFFQKIDTHVSFLIDGYDTGEKKSKMSATEIIRLSPIVMRLRLILIQKLDHSRALLNAARSVPANDETLNILDVEIGRLFEGILERI